MCLAIPGKIIEISQDASGVKTAKTNFGGVVKRVCLEYTPDAQLGDYILVHVGFALGKVDEAEAARTYRLLEEMQQLGELDAPEAGQLETAEDPGAELQTATAAPLVALQNGQPAPLLS